MKLSQIEQIIEIANVGTLSQAAANLYISQPNLSLSIKNAESELGIKLFNRTRSGMTLTRQGVDFVERAKEIMTQVDALQDQCRQDHSPLCFEMNIAAVDYKTLEEEIANLIRQYSSNHIRVNMMNAKGVKLLEYIADNRAEIGFCTVFDFTRELLLRQISIKHLEYHPLCKMVCGIYVANDSRHFSPEMESVNPADIPDIPMVCLSQREFNANTVESQLKKKYTDFVQPTVEVRVDSFGTLRDMINLADGYAITAKLNVRPIMESGYPDIRFIPFVPGVIDAEFGYIQKENTVRSVLANELVQKLSRILR